MTIITNDGQTFTGTPAEIVTQLRCATPLACVRTNAEYMRAVRDRGYLWNHAQVRIDSPEGFLIDLQQAELLDILEP